MATLFSSPCFRPGRGKVPATSVITAAWKELLEMPILASAGASSLGLGSELDFTASGVTIDQFCAFFNAALAAAQKEEPIVEAGNKYSVSSHFKKLNGELLLFEIEQSAAYAALSKKDQARATEFFTFMCLNGYATNGNEALSLAFFSYRSERFRSDPCVIYVVASGEDAPRPDIQACAERLNMQFHVLTKVDLANSKLLVQAAVVVAGFMNPELPNLADWAESKGISLHVHVWDHEFRRVFSENPEPVHFDLPKGVRSLSLQDGLFRCAYQLYRDTRLRDLHMDLPLVWESAYISPNEGGSGNTTPLYVDFCFMLLGWSALHDIARHTDPSMQESIQPMVLAPYGNWVPPVLQGKNNMDDVLDWAKASMKSPRRELEENFFQFQRNFVGGKGRFVEAVASGGGTRSGNFAFESVRAKAKVAMGTACRIKLICGNPHLLVERAERRYEFDVIRIPKDGALCVDALRREIRDPLVGIVYAQTLSITDGITDPLDEIVTVIEEENRRRQSAKGLLVTLVNDCCLALSVLLHNDGSNGSKSLRVLDLTENCITPTIVMLDAHKHIGADKGVSMAMGTPGTLSHLSGHVKVGAQPTSGELVRAMADMLLVGVNGYYEKYHQLGAAVEDLTQKINNAGMKIIHSHNRARGSTAFGVEDPSACVQKKMKTKKHAPSPLYGLAPGDPSRCQTGFLLSLTPHALREVRGGHKALDVFMSDLVESHKYVSDNYSSLAKLFRENSLPAFLLSGGNEELWAFELLRRPGIGRSAVSLTMRRLYSGILDSGVICSEKQSHAVKMVAKRFACLVVLLLSGLVQRKHMSRL